MPLPLAIWLPNIVFALLTLGLWLCARSAHPLFRNKSEI
jgi:hypothetical protein